MTIYIDSDYKCHTSNDGSMREIETNFFDGKCEAFISGYRFVPHGETWNGFRGEMVAPWKPYEELSEIQKAVDANDAEWAKKVEEAEYTTDADGNIYHKEVGTDGEIHLVLTESYTGELYQ